MRSRGRISRLKQSHILISSRRWSPLPLGGSARIEVGPRLSYLQHLKASGWGFYDDAESLAGALSAVCMSSRKEPPAVVSLACVCGESQVI